MPDQTTPRPAGLDALLGHVAAHLPDSDAATAEAAAQLAPLAAAICDERARHDDRVASAALYEVADLLRHIGSGTWADAVECVEARADARSQPAAAPLVELRIPRVPDPATAGVLGEIATERVRQNEKWGQQNHPDGTGGINQVLAADAVRRGVQRAAAEGRQNWVNVLGEEVAEAFAESDPERLRAELVQVAAVAVAWIEAIDRRTTAAAEPERS